MVDKDPAYEAVSNGAPNNGVGSAVGNVVVGLAVIGLGALFAYQRKKATTAAFNGGGAARPIPTSNSQRTDAGQLFREAMGDLEERAVSWRRDQEEQSQQERERRDREQKDWLQKEYIQKQHLEQQRRQEDIRRHQR